MTIRGASLFQLLVAVAAAIIFVNGEASSTTIQVKALYPRSLSSLYLRGNGCGLSWDRGVRMSMTQEDESVFSWQSSIDCGVADEAAGTLEVKVLIDDERWMLGANHYIALNTLLLDAGSITNTTHSVNASAGSVETMYPWFFTYSGSLTKIDNVYSPELHNTRDVIYYLPPSYNENTLKKYSNVLVMHDGQNLFNPLTSFLGVAWMCQDTMDDLIIEGKSEEVLIAGAYNTPDRMDEYTYVYDPSEKAGGKGDLYLDWIESTLLPLTDKSFRVDLQRDRLGILGSSLGGLISCYAAWTRSDIYGKAGCMSSSFWWDDNDFQKNIMTASNPGADNPNLSLPHIYMDAGTAEAKTTMLYTSQVYDICVGDGFVEDVEVFQYTDVGGEHSESSWGPRFHIPIEDLYPPSTV